MPKLSAGSDYIDNSKVLVFSGDSVQTVSIQIIDDGISEPSASFFGLLSSADGIIIPPNIHLEPTRATATIINKNGTIELHIGMHNQVMIIIRCADLPKSVENNTNITCTVLVVVFVSILVLLIVIAAIVIVICLIFKKNKRKILDLQEHVFDSVSLPQSTRTSLSKSTKLVSCESDDAKQKTSDPNCELTMTDNVAYGSYKPKFKLTDNVAYGSYKPKFKLTDNVAYGSYKPKFKLTDNVAYSSYEPKFELTSNVAYGSYKPLSTTETTVNMKSTTADL